MYGFTETSPLNDIGGVRRTTVEEFQQQINWADPAQRQRYVMLVDDVLENYPDTDGKPHEVAKKVRRALQLASTQAVAPETTDDLWPVGTRVSYYVRVFISHLATRREEAHKIAEVLRHVGFACFVAHDQIQPSRSWLREIERALRSCDILLAYVTPGFADSDWTDQEVGWALGRDLVVIPVSVEGAVPTGFLGTYQAVVATTTRSWPLSAGRYARPSLTPPSPSSGQRLRPFVTEWLTSRYASSAKCEARKAPVSGTAS